MPGKNRHYESAWAVNINQCNYHRVKCPSPRGTATAPRTAYFICIIINTAKWGEWPSRPALKEVRKMSNYKLNQFRFKTIFQGRIHTKPSTYGPTIFSEPPAVSTAGSCRLHLSVISHKHKHSKSHALMSHDGPGYATLATITTQPCQLFLHCQIWCESTLAPCSI